MKKYGRKWLTSGVGAVTMTASGPPGPRLSLGICGIMGVLGGLIWGGAHELIGDSNESSVRSLSLSSKGSMMMEGKSPTVPAKSPDLTIPFHHPSSTPLGIRLRILILSPALNEISSEPVAS